MNNICKCLLNKFKESCNGGYAIFSIEELLGCAPADEPVSFDDITQAMDYLAEQKYIDIKYSRGDMYCIALLNEYVQDGGAVLAEVANVAATTDNKRLYILCAALAFAGAFLGSFIVCVIFAAVG